MGTQSGVAEAPAIAFLSQFSAILLIKNPDFWIFWPRYLIFLKSENFARVKFDFHLIFRARKIFFEFDFHRFRLYISALQYSHPIVN